MNGLRALMGQPPRAQAPTMQPPVDKNRLATATDVISSEAEKAILEPSTLALIKYKDAVDAIKAADGIMAGMNAPQQNLSVAESTKMQAEEGIRGLAERLSPGIRSRGKQVQTAQARKMIGGMPRTRAQGGIIGLREGGDTDTAIQVGSGQPIPMLMQKYGSEKVMEFLKKEKELKDIEGNVAPERREEFEMMKANIESLFDPQMIRDIRRARTGPDEIEMSEGGLMFDAMGFPSNSPQFLKNYVSNRRPLSSRPTMGPPDPRTKRFQEETDSLEFLRRRIGERTFLEGLRDFMGEEDLKEFLRDKEVRRKYMQDHPELLNQIKAREEATARLQEVEGNAEGGEIQKFNQGTEVRRRRRKEASDTLPFSENFAKLLPQVALASGQMRRNRREEPPRPTEATDDILDPTTPSGAGDPDAQEVSRTGILDVLNTTQGDPNQGDPNIVPRQTTAREDLTTQLLEVLGQPLATTSISPELEAMRPDLLAAERTMLDPDRPAREQERISREAREAYAIPQELRDLVAEQRAELAKPLYSEQEESSRRIDAAISALASSNRAFQSGPRALAALNKVTDDIEKFRRENTEKSFQLGVGLIEKDMAAGQRAFDAGLEAQKTANGQLTAAIQTLSSRLTGADNIAFNRSLQQRQQEVAAITAQLDQLNKAEQLDVQERQLLVNIARNTTTNLSSLRTMRKNLQDQFAIVADRQDKTQADEIMQLMTLVDGQIAAEQGNLDFINSRFGLEVAPPPASGSDDQIIDYTDL